MDNQKKYSRLQSEEEIKEEINQDNIYAINNTNIIDQSNILNQTNMTSFQEPFINQSLEFDKIEKKNSVTEQKNPILNQTNETQQPHTIENSYSLKQSNHVQRTQSMFANTKKKSFSNRNKKKYKQYSQKREKELQNQISQEKMNTNEQQRFHFDRFDQMESNVNEKLSVYDYIQEKQEEILLSPFYQFEDVLIQMGYSQIKIRLLYENHQNLETVEDALELLELKSLGYFHYFIKKESNENECAICDEHANLHYYENLHDLENGLYEDLDQIRDQIKRTLSQSNHSYSHSFSRSSFRQQQSQKRDQEIEEEVEPIDERQDGAIYCEICCQFYREIDMFNLANCDHDKFCKNCMKDHLQSNIEDGKVIKIKCMSYQCNQQFRKEDIQNFGSKLIYEKYLKFKENIDVELNPRLKWCPTKGCLSYVKQRKSCCCFRNISQCDQCKQRMCFKCGQKEHQGIKCGRLKDNIELQNYIISYNVTKCPYCGYGTEKNEGCNHMICQKCQNHWCWICGQKIYPKIHYIPINIFGCPGGQFQQQTNFQSIMIKIFILIFMPIALFLGPIIGNIAFWCKYVCNVRRCHALCIFFLLLLIFPISFVISVGVGILLSAVFSIPAQFYQLISILKIMCRHFDCCRCLKILFCCQCFQLCQKSE